MPRLRSTTLAPGVALAVLISANGGATNPTAAELAEAVQHKYDADDRNPAKAGSHGCRIPRLIMIIVPSG